MNAKPWQIAVIVIGLLFGGGFIIYQVSRSSSPLPHTARLIDVVSGDVFDVDTSRVGQIALPAAHPDTGIRTLVRIREIEPGRWTVPERDLLLVKDLAREFQVQAIDPQSGELKSALGTIRTYRKFSG